MVPSGRAMLGVAVPEGSDGAGFPRDRPVGVRRFTMADVDNLVNLDADPDVMRFVTGGIPTSRKEIPE